MTGRGASSGVAAIRRVDHAGHRRWVISFIGAMWCALRLYRVLLLFTGPTLRGRESASLLISIWFSAPLGVLIAGRVAAWLSARLARLARLARVVAA